MVINSHPVDSEDESPRHSMVILCVLYRLPRSRNYFNPYANFPKWIQLPFFAAKVTDPW